MSGNMWSRRVQWLLAITLPVLLLAINLRVVSGHWFVRWEYRRPGFPTDPYGLSTDARIHLATTCQDYLASHADITVLADLELGNGEPAFNERELRHMADVQGVYFGITVAGLISGLLWLGAGIGAAVRGRMSHRLPAALLSGSLVTLALLVVVGGSMVASWGQFFTTFHRLFFAGDSWIFPNSDTLIRLFPIRFWIDIAAALVGLLVLEGLALGAAAWAAVRATGSDRTG